MEGPPLAGRIRAEVAEEVRDLGGLNLVTVQVGDDPGSTIYLRRKHEAAQEAGIESDDRKLPEETTEEDLLALVAELDLGRPTLVPATPLGIMALLAEHRIPLEGADAVVIGRSDIVGKPIAHLLLQANATVTICHSRTVDLARYTLEADVLVVAVGSPEVVTADMVKRGAAVVDVGINRTDDGIVGDVDPEAANLAGFITPVPGGVGPMPIAMVLRNAVKAARYRRGLLAFPQGWR